MPSNTDFVNAQLRAPSEAEGSAYFLVMLRVIEAAAEHDSEKFAVFVTSFIDRLRADGRLEVAKAIERAVAKSRARQLLPQSLPGTARQDVRVPLDLDAHTPLADLDWLGADDVDYEIDPSLDESLNSFLSLAEHREQLLAAGISAPANLLLHGPPGCGKTLTARYISAKLGLPLLTARVDAMVSSYLGNTAKNIRSLFSAAASQNCVLFLDELDAIGKSRDDEHELGELKRVVIGLLQNIDHVSSKIVLIAATNHEHLLDAAIWRRFPYTIAFPNPALTFRASLFSRFSKGELDPHTEALAHLSPRLTVADIRASVEQERIAAIVNSRPLNVLSVMATLLNSERQGRVSPSDLKLLARKAKRIAPSYFSAQRLAHILGVSAAKVAAYLRG